MNLFLCRQIQSHARYANRVKGLASVLFKLRIFVGSRMWLIQLDNDFVRKRCEVSGELGMSPYNRGKRALK